MESSSDDSFAWTDASPNPDSGDNSSTEETMSDKPNESEWEKGYKKKLHKKLFKTESEDTHDLPNGHSVKCEPESDAPSSTSPQKKRRKHKYTTGSDSEQVTDYLNELVKNESNSTKECSPDDKPKRLKIKQTEEYYDNKDNSQELMDFSDHVTKKKKSKRKKEMQDDSSDMIIEDMFSAEETVVETRLERNREPSMTMQLKEDEPLVVKKRDKKKKKRNHDCNSLGNDSVQEVDTASGGEISEILTQEDSYNDRREILTNKEEKNCNKSQNGPSKISDRIQFEDGEDLLAACNEIVDNKSQSSKLRRFIKANPHLQSLPCVSGGNSTISQDDEIWLFNCPHEVNVLSLKDSDITLDSKCKIKIDSQTFVGSMDNDMNSTAILSFQNGRPLIKNYKLNGVVNLRKRIPKAHYVQDNVMANNETDFIPLPETKCRHPLFGPDYKKAIKLPSSVKARLHSSQFEAPPTVTEGKKKKKRKYEEIDNSEEMVADNNEKICGAKHKHRHSGADSDQPTRKKSKKVKHEKESAETWDSEKAIEDNLFNF